MLVPEVVEVAGALAGEIAVLHAAAESNPRASDSLNAVGEWVMSSVGERWSRQGDPQRE
jgi:hypothetical protein